MKTIPVVSVGCRINNEKGFVLILCMVMLATLSILGVMVLNTTNTELGITTNARSNSDAMVGAELATEYAIQKVVSDPNSITGPVNLADEDDDLADILPPGIELIASADNEIFNYTGVAPLGMSTETAADAYDAENIYRSSGTASEDPGGEAAYYRVSVNVKARGRSTARVETLFVNRGGQVY
jgi:hypothetical protein